MDCDIFYDLEAVNAENILNSSTNKIFRISGCINTVTHVVSGREAKQRRRADCGSPSVLSVENQL